MNAQTPRGCSGSRYKPIPGLNKNEEIIVATEFNVGLSQVPYSVFMQAIKQYGYKSDLQEKQLRAVSRDINLDPSKLDDEVSEVALVYKSEQLFYQGTYKVSWLLRLGFLMCVHRSEQHQVLVSS